MRNSVKNKITYIETVVDKIEQIHRYICYGESNIAFENVNGIIDDISNVLGELIENAEVFKQIDVEIPEDVIGQQVDNFAEAMECKDSVLLADTLNYEIKNTLLFYIDIINELEKNNIVL